MTPDGPKILTINVTESCDAACRYCHWWRVKSKNEPIGQLLHAVDEAAALGVRAIRISGGEPMLREDLTRLVAQIRKHGLISMVCTAAKCDRAALEALVDAGLDVLSVSLDTIEPEVFRRIRGYAVEPVLRNVRALAELRRETQFEIVLSVVLSRLSLDGISELLDFARALDLVVSFTPYQDGSPERRSPMTSLAMREADEPRLRRTLDLVLRHAGAGLRVVNADSFLRGIANFMMTRRLPEGYTCRAGDTAAIRFAGGELRLCHSLPGVVSGGLSAAWSSEAAGALRAKMARLDCPGCWLSCHADERRALPHRHGRPEIWEVL
jgi:MoaA/NifB/PqqE/SkfB family radical SAM enzyme